MTDTTPPPLDAASARTHTARPPWAWRLLVGSVCAMARSLFGWRLRVREGLLPTAEQPLVVVANHTSYVDPFLVADTVLRRTGHWIRPLAKVELFGLPVIGPLARRAGGIPVARETGEGREEAFAAAIAQLREGGTVYVAPEGTITHDGMLLPLRHGAARLALAAGADVLVVTSFGAQRGFSPVVTRPQRGAEVHLALDLLPRDPEDDPVLLTGRIAATMLARSEELASGYTQGGPGEPWWPPYAVPGRPTATARENLERYRSSMGEAVEAARARMAELAAEGDLEERLVHAGERARAAATQARHRAEELVDQVRHRAEELAELSRTGAFGDEARHRAEVLARQARDLAEQARELLEESRTGHAPVTTADPAAPPAAPATGGRPVATGDPDPAAGRTDEARDPSPSDVESA